MPRNSMDKVFQCVTGSGVAFPVRIVITESAYKGLNEHNMRDEVEAILDMQPVPFISPTEKRSGIKQEPGFYAFWTTTKLRLRTSEKGLTRPSPNMTLRFDTLDKGMH